MKNSTIAALFFFASCIMFSSCQKLEYDDEDGDDKKEQVDPGQDNDDNEEDGESAPVKRKKYTVTQFLEEAPASQVWVEGYIVGECKQKIGNARFAPPFSYGTSILLADDFDKTKNGEYIPVCLKSGSNARKKLNLKDNPGMYHKKVKIYALREKYFGVTGIKDIDDFEIVE